jgi:hypothetical protein
MVIRLMKRAAAGYTLTRDVPLPIDDTGRQPPWRALEFRRD